MDQIIEELAATSMKVLNTLEMKLNFKKILAKLKEEEELINLEFF